MAQTVDNPILNETIEAVEAALGDTLGLLGVERVVFGLFFTGVKLSSGQGGTCFTPIKEIPEAVCCPSSARAMPSSGKLARRPVTDYLEDLFDSNPLKRTLAIAVLNALSATCWQMMGADAMSYSIELGRDAFDEVEIPDGKSVVVGALAPILKKLIAAEADFTVLEMDPAPLKPAELEHFLPANKAVQVVPDADLLVITGTTLINNTLDGLLALAKPGAQIIVTGPTASMLPDAFFARGVTTIGGILVTKPRELLDVIGEAGSGYHFFGKSAERIVINR